MAKTATVVLTEYELKDLYGIVSRRQDSKDVHEVRNKRVTTRQGDLEIHYLGIRAELAVIKWLNEVGYETSPLNRGDGPEGDDTIKDILIGPGTPGEISVQVKSTTHPGGHLIFPPGGGPDKEFKADIAVLVVEVNKSTLKIVGWTDREHFLEKHKMKSFRIGPQPAMSQAALWDIEDMIQK